MTKQRVNYLIYKGYTGDINYSLANNCLFGKVLGLDKGLISYEGETLKDLEHDFRNGIDDYLAYCQENDLTPKKPFTGQFSVRLSPELHRLMATTAQERGITVNKLIKQAIELDSL